MSFQNKSFTLHKFVGLIQGINNFALIASALPWIWTQNIEIKNCSMTWCEIQYEYGAYKTLM